MHPMPLLQPIMSSLILNQCFWYGELFLEALSLLPSQLDTRLAWFSFLVLDPVSPLRPDLLPSSTARQMYVDVTKPFRDFFEQEQCPRLSENLSCHCFFFPLFLSIPLFSSLFSLSFSFFFLLYPHCLFPLFPILYLFSLPVSLTMPQS